MTLQSKLSGRWPTVRMRYSLLRSESLPVLIDFRAVTVLFRALRHQKLEFWI